jgi:hypothetical protein
VKALLPEMSEIKFNCPVCGQHIATDSNAAGALIECPTCFQAINIPQAPAQLSKYTLSATQYIKPPPASRPPPPIARATVTRTWSNLLFLALFCACVVGVIAWVLHSRSRRIGSSAETSDATNGVTDPGLSDPWRLDLQTASFPEDIARGRVHGLNFVCQQAYFQNGVLALRQGKGYQPDIVVNLYLSATEPQAFAGRQFYVTSNSVGATPRIVLRWRDRDLQVLQAFTNGYAMKLDFGTFAEDRVAGKIYLCLPDSTRSFVVGNFDAEVRKSPAPRQ